MSSTSLSFEHVVNAPLCTVLGCVYPGEFEDVEENKLIYTDLFRQYTQLVGELPHTISLCGGSSALSFLTSLNMVDDTRGAITCVGTLFSVHCALSSKPLAVTHRTA